MARLIDLLTQFIRNSPVIAFIKDLEGRYLHVSEAWLHAFHTTREAVEGKTDHELFDAAQADDFVRNDREVLSSGLPSRRYETVLVPPEVRTFLSTKFPLLGGLQGHRGVAGFAIDVTEQQRTLEELELQKRFLERTQAMSSVGGWEFDVAGKKLVWTTETFRLFELPEKDGEPEFEQALISFAPEHRESLRAAHLDALSKGVPYRLEVELLQRSGRRLRVHVHAVPELVDGQLRRLSGAIQDVTEVRLVEEKLRHSSRMDAVGQLAGGVAHDFNNMLGAIVSAGELLRFEKLTPDGNDALNTILTAATQAAGLTRQLLLFGRKERSRRVPADLHTVLADALTILQRTLSRRITLVVEQAATHSRLLADTSQLSNALINLALNARDAMPDGGTLTFRTVNEGPTLIRLDVVDTGMGMAPEVLSHIFDPFFTTKERGRGTGLGLATVHTAVRAHEGDITVRSEVGEGSTFQLRFPLLPGDVEVVSEKTSSPVPQSKRHELLLIVDDEELVRRSMRMLLERLGFRVLEAGDGAQALQVMVGSEERPALVVLDLMMPGLSAVETFRAAREILPDLPFLFCSGYAPESMLASIQSAERTGRLAKPFSAEELQAAVRSLLVTPKS